MRAIVASLVLSQAGAFSTFAAVGCFDRCPDDDAEGRCAPTCDDCACCVRPPILGAPASATPLVVAEPRLLPSREPRAIQAEVAAGVFRPPRLGGFSERS
jgi:hypothetical protein